MPDLRASTLSLRRAARHTVLDASYARYTLLGRIDPSLAKPRVQFIYLHHAAAPELGRLRDLLRQLGEGNSFISYSDAVQLVLDGGATKPYVSISFDDGFASDVGAARVLEEFGVSACFFVCPSFVSEQRPEIVEAICRERLHRDPTPFLTWDDVESLVSAGHEIGSHGMSHVNLAELSSDALERELSESHAELTARLGMVKHFAWPYGRFEHFTATGRDQAYRVGYVSCASAERGCHLAAPPGGLEELCIRRDQVIPSWPIHHSLLFLARNSLKAAPEGSTWPRQFRSDPPTDYD